MNDEKPTGSKDSSTNERELKENERVQDGSYRGGKEEGRSNNLTTTYQRKIIRVRYGIAFTDSNVISV